MITFCFYINFKNKKQQQQSLVRRIVHMSADVVRPLIEQRRRFVASSLGLDRVAARVASSLRRYAALAQPDALTVPHDDQHRFVACSEATTRRECLVEQRAVGSVCAWLNDRCRLVHTRAP